MLASCFLADGGWGSACGHAHNGRETRQSRGKRWGKKTEKEELGCTYKMVKGQPIDLSYTRIARHCACHRCVWVCVCTATATVTLYCIVVYGGGACDLCVRDCRKLIIGAWQRMISCWIKSGLLILILILILLFFESNLQIGFKFKFPGHWQAQNCKNPAC